MTEALFSPTAMPSGAATVPQLALMINYVDPAVLKPDAKNARRHGRRQEKALDRSIREFGFVSPILADGTGKIIAGHARLSSAKRLGLTRVPVVRLEHLSEAQARALMIADNRLTDMSDWDDALLADNLRLLCEAGIDIDPEVTGFTMGEIDLRIELADGADAEDEEDLDDLPTPNAGPAVSVVGDLWLLGNDGRHQLICGDARNDKVYARLMGGKRAHTWHFAAQYQQRPAPLGGGIFKDHCRRSPSDHRPASGARCSCARQGIRPVPARYRGGAASPGRD